MSASFTPPFVPKFSLPQSPLQFRLASQAHAAWLKDVQGGVTLPWCTLSGKVYLATGHHDMRKSINGLAACRRQESSAAKSTERAIFHGGQYSAY